MGQMGCSVFAAELAHDAAVERHERRVERALFCFRTEAMAKLREDACTDADAIRDVLSELTAPELERITRAALSGDLLEIGRTLANPLTGYVRARECDELDIESEALRMLGDGE
jgi:hypothetical protein